MSESEKRLCRHCGQKKATRHRRLCWRCYYTPGVRELHAVKASKFNVQGVRDFNGPAKPSGPLTSLPGTPERVAELEARAEAGMDLWGTQL